MTQILVVPDRSFDVALCFRLLGQQTAAQKQ